MNLLKEKIYSFLLNQEINPELDIFNYGFNVCLRYFVFLVIVLPISIVSSNFVEILLVLIVFISLRQYLGGLHFTNSNLCMIFSITVVLIIPYLSNCVSSISIWFRTLIFIVSICTVLLLGPMDHKNKRLSDDEKAAFKKKAIKMTIFYYLFSVLLDVFKYEAYANIIITTVVFITINLFFAYIQKNK